MNIRIMRLSPPEFIKKKKLKELFRLTADAFQAELPELRGLSFQGCLSEYARFTREQAVNCLRKGHPAGDVRDRLYENSFALGRKLRKSFHIMTWEESVKALQAIYRMLGIEFRYGRQNEDADGRNESADGRNESADGQNESADDLNGHGVERCYFSIHRCFFSDYYTAEVCRLISALDEGLAAGLFEEGRLCFQQRITEGGGCCRGYIQKGGCS